MNFREANRNILFLKEYTCKYQVLTSSFPKRYKFVWTDFEILKKFCETVTIILEIKKSIGSILIQVGNSTYPTDIWFSHLDNSFPIYYFANDMQYTLIKQRLKPKFNIKSYYLWLFDFLNCYHWLKVTCADPEKLSEGGRGS